MTFVPASDFLIAHCLNLPLLLTPAACILFFSVEVHSIYDLSIRMDSMQVDIYISTSSVPHRRYRKHCPSVIDS
ncbi:hypothetical protein K503DRAFT_172588 [Rhizopogon vinicolor AM-OR11-026]|uniref:Uncharacterized protein n=1 Tax=Rhizopogon vinicolor AM-OR11-026 TaxID=1314800 RepID=A0A1B7N077_9AGAM|nr:hypothetical protein K503DRAFT_172588 [Rhizopogon vinicolor AM-OR11-026]